MLALLAALGHTACGDDELATGAVGAVGAQTTGTGAGGGGGTGGAGGGPACGDGTVDPDEACDDGGETASCDADCTPVSCGDGQHNRAAGEGCDDGNNEDGDACSATCQPSIVALEPGISTISVAVAVAYNGGPFSVVWTGGASNVTFQYAALGVNGITPPTSLGGGANAAYVTAGNDETGRVMLLQALYGNPNGELSWRFVAPNGAPPSTPATTETAPLSFFPAGIPNGKLFGTSTGTFCAMGHGGEVRCTSASGALLPPAFVSDSAVLSAHLLAVGDGVIASYVTDGPSINESEFRVVALDPTGAQQSEEIPLAGVDANAYASGGVVRPDGTFGVAVSRAGDVTWYPYHASGQLDATNVRSIGTPQTARAKLAGGPGGRFFLVWYEYEASSTCSLIGRVFDETVTPVALPEVLFQAPSGTCVARYDIASSPDGDVAIAWMSYHASGGYSAHALYLPRALEP